MKSNKSSRESDIYIYDKLMQLKFTLQVLQVKHRAHTMKNFHVFNFDKLETDELNTFRYK
jgi:hypothetical protein